MAKCIICGEDADYDAKLLCCVCADLPKGITRLASKQGEEYTPQGKQVGGWHWPHDEGFTFTQENWMLFSKVVDRLREVGRPVSIIRSVIVDNVISLRKYAILDSHPATHIFTLISPLSGINLVEEDPATWIFSNFNTSKDTSKEEDSNEGKIYNPITGEWSWF